MRGLPQTELRPFLNPNETLLWSGQPKSGIIFRKTDLFFIPFSLLWCGFAIVWTVTAASASPLFALFGIPFVIIGLIMVFGRFIADRKLRMQTYYGITNDRILLKSGLFKQTFKSISISSIDHLQFSLRDDGFGTILLAQPSSGKTDPSGLQALFTSQTFNQLDLIRDVEKVHALILALQAEKNSNPKKE